MSKTKVEKVARQEFLRTIPFVISMMSNQKFVKKLDKLGYRFDVEAILQAVNTATGWKGPSPIQKVKARA